MRKLTLLAMLALTACAGPPEPGCARLPDGARYCLQKTTAMMPLQATQRVDVARDGNVHNLVAEVEVDAAGMRMVVVTPFGQKLLQLEYDNQMARVDGVNAVKERLDPVLAAALVQLVLWPAEAVRAGLGGSATLEETPRERRVLGASGALLLSVQTEGALPVYRKLRVTAPAAHLVLDIETLQDAPQ